MKIKGAAVVARLERRSSSVDEREVHSSVWRVDDRTRLIRDLAVALQDSAMPTDMRDAGLALIGWLARRMPGEEAHDLGVEEARVSLSMRTARRRDEE